MNAYSHQSKPFAHEETRQLDDGASQVWEEVLSARGQVRDGKETLRPVMRIGTMSVANTERASESSAMDGPAEHAQAVLGEEYRDYPFADRYHPYALLGKGGMGRVLLAQQQFLQRPVALKVLRRHSSFQHRDQFTRESRILARLEHPHIIPVYDAGDGWLVMKQVEGMSFEQLLSNSKAVAMDRLVEILIRTCEAISYAHEQGVIHRDLKAANIMLGGHGKVLVVDWGLAVEMQQGLQGNWQLPTHSAINVFAGTPGCLPPEVARGQAKLLGPAVDVFLLGALLYRILSGHMPYSDSSPMRSVQRAAVLDYAPLSQVAAQHSPLLRQLCTQAMAEHPHQRPIPDEFAQSLREWLRHAAMEERALTALAQAREARDQAQALGRDQWDHAYVLYNRSVANYENALALLPNLQKATEERLQTLHAFAMAALAVGNIFLARMLVGGQRPPTINASAEKEHSYYNNSGDY